MDDSTMPEKKSSPGYSYVVPGYSKPTEVERFNPNDLTQYFTNLIKIPDDPFTKYVVLNEYGSHVAEIIYMGTHEYRYMLDNFPAPRRYYSSNLPVTTLAVFKADVLRVGILSD